MDFSYRQFIFLCSQSVTNEEIRVVQCDLLYLSFLNTVLFKLVETRPREPLLPRFKMI